MDVFTEISNWNLFEWCTVMAFGLVGIALQNIGQKLENISNQIHEENRHICQIREDRSKEDDYPLGHL
jgi:hypothetical protein